MRKVKLLIIGSGPAGYTAAIYAARANLSPLVLAGFVPGGQLTITTDVENYPGFAAGIQGPFLVEQMRLQAENVGAEIIYDEIVSIDASKRPFLMQDSSGNSYEADSVIVATGASAKWLGLKTETEFMGYGVSGCATCDGFFYKNQIVMVIGGGNTAVEEALYLTHHAKKVYLMHRRNELKAEKILQRRVLENNKIELIWDSELQEVLGSDNPKSVNSVRIKNVKTAEEQIIEINGLFVAIGHKPNSNFLKEKVACDEEGYIITEKGSTKTSVEGIFAAGDVQDKIFRQAVTAAGSGCMAALEVEKFLHRSS